MTPRSFAQSLIKYSKYSCYELIGTDSNKYALGLYMPQLFCKTYLVPKVDDPKYWCVLDKIIEREKIDIAVINPELEVVEWAKRRMNYDFPVKVLLPHFDLASKIVDKAFLSETLESYGVAPRSFSITREDLNQSKPLSLAYPFWIRSALGSSGMGSMKISSFEELQNWINVNPKIDKFLASEFLPGRNLGCKLLYFNGVLLRSAVAERVYYIMSKVAPSGITGNTCFGRLINSPEAFRNASQAMDIMFEKTHTPKHGFFTVDMKETAEGKPLVTEVNIRFVAFTQCYAAAGANLPEDLIRIIDSDPNFNHSFKLYDFQHDLVFLRDVDEQPIVMKESELLELEM